jgi:AcrR family transcriptional regulator
MPRIKEDERQQVLGTTRQRLLEAAANEFARLGYSDANINTISTAAGFAKGTIYNYFPSKRALLMTLIDTAAQEHFDFIVDQVRPEPDVQRRLEILFRAGFEYIAHSPTRSRVLFNTINGPDEALKAHVFEAYQPIFRFVAEEILVLGYERSIFRSVEPDSMALLLMTIYLGTASQLDPQGRPWLDPGQVASLVLNGLIMGKDVINDHGER